MREAGRRGKEVGEEKRPEGQPRQNDEKKRRGMQGELWQNQIKIKPKILYFTPVGVGDRGGKKATSRQLEDFPASLQVTAEAAEEIR